MSENTVRIISDFEPLPKKPKVYPWHWLSFFLFNLYRKPLVWKKQRELMRLLKEVKADLEQDVFPELIANQQSGCYECRDIYFALRSQDYLSSIEKLLRNLECNAHQTGTIRNFLFVNAHKFSKSEEISKWINNL